MREGCTFTAQGPVAAQRKARKRAGGQNPAQVRLAIPFALHDAVQITARFSFITIRKLLTAGPGVDCFAAV
jgi:hypothetical protein